MSLSHCGTLLASCALDDMVKIIEVSHLADRPVDGTFDMDAYERSVESKLVANHGKVAVMDDDDGDGDEDEKMDEGGDA